MASRGITVQRFWRVGFGFAGLILMAICIWSDIGNCPGPLPVVVRASFACQLNDLPIPLAFFFLLRSRGYAHVWVATGLVTLCAILWGRTEQFLTIVGCDIGTVLKAIVKKYEPFSSDFFLMELWILVKILFGTLLVLYIFTGVDRIVYLLDKEWGLASGNPVTLIRHITKGGPLQRQTRQQQRQRLPPALLECHKVVPFPSAASLRSSVTNGVYTHCMV